VVDQPGLRLGLGDSVNYTGDANLVFTHIYGPLPKQLIGKPAIINVFGNKKAKAEEWCGAELHEVSKWAKGLTNTIYTANWTMEPRDLTQMVEDELSPGRGWFPVVLTDELLKAFFSRGEFETRTVFDGFMGRGTVAMSCRALDCDFVGIDRDPERIVIAKEYLGC
jgi:hypothetical protein